MSVLIQEMTYKMSIHLLKSVDIGRIACVAGSQPYVTPFAFRHDGEFIYSFATLGRKIEWMRANPQVCVEVEEIVSRHEWQTVVIFARYQELPETPEFNDARIMAHHLLAQAAQWWEPGFAKTLSHGAERPLRPIYFRISIDEITGHHGLRISTAT
jgi:nitroimidazol reductase NimA-like FMN-containing flavoprotein (pyridoxamine 5'-phosphate oxidase superfamily)